MVKEGLVRGWFGVGFAWFGLGFVMKTCFVANAVLDSTIEPQITSEEKITARLISLGLWLIWLRFCNIKKRRYKSFAWSGLRLSVNVPSANALLATQWRNALHETYSLHYANNQI